MQSMLRKSIINFKSVILFNICSFISNAIALNKRIVGDTFQAKAFIPKQSTVLFDLPIGKKSLYLEIRQMHLMV